jgi:hypothetical protein
VRVAVEDGEQQSVTEPASDIGLSGASTSLTPQVGVVLSAAAACTSNTKVVVPSARLSSKFTFNAAGQRCHWGARSGEVARLAVPPPLT